MKPNAVTITTDGDKVQVTTPYNPTFTCRAKQLGGHWNGIGWIFNAKTRASVRETVLDMFGTDRADYPSVTVRIDADKAWQKDPTGGEVALYFAGRKVLDRRQRDAAIRLGDGVAVIAGTLPRRGGTMKYPSLALNTKDGVILELYDVPAGHADLDNDYVEIVTSTTLSREDLKAERSAIAAQLAEVTETLTTRLAEIDAKLADLS